MKPPPLYHEIHRAKWMRANTKQRARLDAEFKRNRDHNGFLTPPPFDLGTIACPFRVWARDRLIANYRRRRAGPNTRTSHSAPSP